MTAAPTIILPKPEIVIPGFAELPEPIQAVIERLSAPFPIEEVKVRPGAVRRDGTAARPARYIFANHDQTAPSARAFLGHLRALRLVFLPHWADRLWAEGLTAQLITPLPSLGVAAWQIASDQARWHQLVSEAVREKRLARHTFAIAA